MDRLADGQWGGAADRQLYSNARPHAGLAACPTALQHPRSTSAMRRSPRIFVDRRQRNAGRRNATAGPGEPYMEPTLKHILVVDDDPDMRSLIAGYLSQHAFRVTPVSNSQQMNRVISNEIVDIIIVDLNLGHEDGLEIVRTFSTLSDAPIIIISGDRLEEADKVVGLELGADDYITKPFGLREFLARIRALLREKPAPKIERDRRAYHFDRWTLNVRSRTLASHEGEELKLTAGEFNLLTALLRSPRRVLTREQLLAASRVSDEEVFDRSIDVLILRLRRKLEEMPSMPALIKTERGIGYVFDADVTIDERPRVKR